MRMTTVAAIVPSIPPRATKLTRALGSISNQTRPADQIMVAVDRLKEGPSTLRNKMAFKAGTEWVAFLDDDDEWLPEHLECLLNHAEETGADLVYPWFELWVHGKRDDSQDPLAVLGEPPFGRPFDNRGVQSIMQFENFVPVTVLLRREAFMDVGGFPEVNSERWPHKECEDMGCWQDLLNAGAKFSHFPARTWRWHHDGANTSGRTDSW